MANPELKWWHVRWKRLGLRFAIVIVTIWSLVAVGRYVYGFFLPWYLIQNLSKEPSAWVVSTAMPDHGVTQLSGARVGAYGYSIQTPWNEPPEIKPHKGVVMVTFPRSKAGILFFDPNEDTLAHLPVKTSSDPEMERLFSERDRRSFYQLIADEIAARPDEARWWTRNENVRLFMLLSLKQLEILDFKSVYAVEAGTMRGFQFGSATKPPCHVMLKLFDPRDREIRIQISTNADGAATLTQAQLNAMVASIRPVAQ